MKKIWMLGAVMAIAMFVLGASACGGDDDNTQGRPTATAGETPGDVEGTREPKDTPESEGSPAPASDADLDEYFAALEGIHGDREAELTDNVNDHNSQNFFGDPAKEYEALQVLLTRTGTAYELSAVQLADLAAPADLDDLHSALVTATLGRSGVVSRLLADVVDAGNMGDANDVIDTYSPDIDEADAILVDACNALQDTADENSIDVNLLCDQI